MSGRLVTFGITGAFSSSLALFANAQMTGLLTKISSVAGPRRGGASLVASEQATERLVIIGNGMVGFRLLEEMDRAGQLATRDAPCSARSPSRRWIA